MCVHFRYGSSVSSPGAFPGSWLHLLLYLHRCVPSASRLHIIRMAFYSIPATSLAHALPSACPVSLLRHSIHSSEEYRIFRLLSFDYAFRPRLSSRLSQSGRTFLWNPWVFGAMDSHHRFRYSHRHSLFQLLHMSFRSCFFATATLPYHRSFCP